MKYLMVAIFLSFSHFGFAQELGRVATTLEAQASAEVENDEMTVVLSATKEGPKAQELTQSVLATMQRAIARVKRTSSITPTLGNVTTQPVWNAKGRADNLVVRATLVLVSKDFAALGTLASELTNELLLIGVSFNLSKDKRLEAEKRLLADLSESFRQKSDAIAQAFGYKSYEIKLMDFNQSSNRGIVQPLRMAVSSTGSDNAAVPIPIDGGKTTVNITVRSTIDLIR